MKKFYLFIFSICFSSALFAVNFVEGVDYEVIKNATPIRVDKNKIEVVEFFSFGCPWCYKFEPVIENWQNQSPQYVNFSRVHVTFESGWNNLAKAYYTARALKLTPKINSTLFKMVQNNYSKLDEQTLAKLFEEYGINKDDFLSTFRFSTGLNTQIMRGEDLMKSYQVLAVPSIVVAGKYKTDSGMAKGDANHFIETIKFLIEKVRKEKQS